MSHLYTRQGITSFCKSIQISWKKKLLAGTPLLEWGGGGDRKNKFTTARTRYRRSRKTQSQLRALVSHGEPSSTRTQLHTSSYYYSIGTTAHCGLWPVEQCPSIFFPPICHQVSPSSHSQHFKISFYFLFPSFPGSSPSSRPFQFLSEDLFGHPILLHSL